MSETKELRPFLVKALIQRARDHAIQDHCDEVSTVLLIDMANELSRRADTELVDALREVTRHLGDAIEWSDLSAHDNYDEVCAAHERAATILRKREGEA